MAVSTGSASCALAVAMAAILTPAVRGGVTHVEIEETLPYADGREFVGVGAYRRLLGRVHFAVRPDHPANAAVVDLDFAPRNAAGLVEFSADLEILAPVDLEKGNGTVFYEVNNRGRRLGLDLFNAGADHFLMRRGYVVVWSGWIAEVLPADGRLRLDAPVAKRNGEPILGRVRAEMVTNEPATRLNISNRPGMGSYRPTEAGLETATLTWRLRERGHRVPIPREQWSLEVQETARPGSQHSLPKVEMVMPAGFQPGYIYELIYEARDPVVQGLGLAGIRDLVSFLKHDASERNPLRLEEGRPAVHRAIGFGFSQSGRCLRMLLYQGFNADENGRQVFDGLIPHVSGGGLGFFNHRFASPTRYASQHTNHLFPCDFFPFGYENERDPLNGREDGLLRRARAEGVVPKVLHIQNSAEYWHRSGSLVHTDPSGRRDAEIPSEVRIYAVGGAQHGAGSGRPESRGEGQLRDNPTDYRPILRALLVALEAWVRDGTPPPPSRYPRIADGTLVDWRAGHSGWKPLPGVRYPEVIQRPELLDYGPEFLSRGRITRHPPEGLKEYRVLVPAYGPDNNERGMLLLPSIAVPVATYTGWNLRRREIGGANQLLRLKGAYIPFARTAAEREMAGDPRPALLERYRDFDTYLAMFEAAARKLVSERYLLAEDLALLLGRAREREHPTIVVLVDESLSMDIADRYSDDDLLMRLADFFDSTPDAIRATTRYDLLRQLFRSPEIGLLESLRRKGNVVLFSFAKGIRKLKEFPPFEGGDPPLSPADLDFLPSYDDLRGEERVRQTRLSGALGDAVRSVTDETFAGGKSKIYVVLMSDGQQTAGSLLPEDMARRLGQRGYKVYTVGVGRPNETKDIRVIDLKANEVVLLGERVSFDAIVMADGFEGERARVDLKVDGSIADTRYLILEGAGRRQSVRLDHRPPKPGDFVATVEVEHLSDELFKENNIASKPVRVVKQKVKVLCVEERPRWEYRYLKNTLIRDSTMEARFFLFSPDEKSPQENSPAAPLLSGFPRTRAELSRYDVIVIGDVPPDELGEDAMKLLKDFVEEGGGLIFIAGPNANPSQYLHTDLYSLLPLEVSESDLRPVITTAFHIELTTVGRDHPVMRLVNDRERNISLWESPSGKGSSYGGLPGFFWFAEVRREKKGVGVVLARHPTRRDPTDKNGLPIFAFMEHGKGRTFFSGVDNTWRLRAGGDERHHQRFWGQVVRFVAGGQILGGAAGVSILTNKFRYTIGETVKIECRVSDVNMQPSIEPTLSVYKLARSRSKEPPEKLELSLDRQAPGTYHGSIVAERMGLHDLWVGTEGEPLAFRSFHVKIPVVEMSDPRRNQPSLEKVAELSGGRHFELHEVQELVESLGR